MLNSNKIILLTLLVCLGYSNSDYVTQDAVSILNQYFQCKILSMTQITDFQGTYYIPNPNIANNTLTDEFYQTNGFGNMTFNESMVFIRNIYLELDNCTSEFCNCTKWVFIDHHNVYGNSQFSRFANFFKNEINFKEITSIIAIFGYNYLLSMKPMEDLIGQYDLGFKFPTLAKFAVYADFSNMRANMYDYNWCPGINTINQTVFISFYD